MKVAVSCNVAVQWTADFNTLSSLDLLCSLACVRYCCGAREGVKKAGCSHQGGGTEEFHNFQSWKVRVFLPPEVFRVCSVRR